MMKIPRCFRVLFGCLVGACLVGHGDVVHGQVPSRPNIVLIQADDLGFADVGFNGQTLIKTPNLDRLASEGMQFRQGYCPASVCAPTRAALMSGFHTGHTFVDRNLDTTVAGGGYRAEDVLMPQMLRDAGYSTAVFGKWGFGEFDRPQSTQVDLPDSLPNAKGVQDFYGYLGHSQGNRYRPNTLWQGDETGVTLVNNANAYTHDQFANRSEQYIATRAGSGTPFFLYASFTIPHTLYTDISTVPNWDAEYQGPQYAGWTTTQKQYAAMVTRLDASVGKIMSRLDDPNQDGNKADSIANNTLILFTSDNGPEARVSLEPLNLFDSNGIYRGSKRDLYEGGVRVPLVARWTGTIQPGVSNRMVELSDWMPTFAALAGGTVAAGVDGVSLAPMLTGNGVQRNRDYLYYEANATTVITEEGGILPRWAVRRGDYKLIKFSGTAGYQLFNLATDPSETTPLNLTTFASVKTSLESIALAEGAEQDGNYAMTYRQWTGTSGSFSADANWSGSGSPSAVWSASIVNSTTTSRIVTTDTTAASVLGLEVASATAARQTLDVQPGHVVTGRNEIRVGPGGVINLKSGTGQIGVLESVRWIDVLSGGSLTGEGEVRGVISGIMASLYNSGTVAPGQPSFVNAADPIGILNVTGNFAQASSGVLDLQVKGHNNTDLLNPMFDQLLATGTASISGRLTIRLIDGYLPAIGDTFELVRGSSRLGQFSEVDGLTIDDSRSFQISYTPTSVVLTAVPEPATWGVGIAGFALLLTRRRRRIRVAK